MKPPFRADQVGSLLRPGWLAEARGKRKAGAIGAAALKEAEDRAIREAVARYSSAELQKKLEAASVPYAPVRRPDQLLDDPHLRETGQLLAVPMEDGKIGNLPKLPFSSSAYPFTLRRKPPGLGENTREVLAEAGLGKAEIDALIAAKVAVQG